MNDAPGASQPTSFGGWRYVHATGTWDFSPELLALADVGSDDSTDISPLFERMPDPAERERLRGLIEYAIETGGSLAGQFRLSTLHRGDAIFALVADTIRDDAGRPVELRGYSTDVTEEVRVATRAAVDAATRHRRSIEQVKGALMVTYRLDEVTAFALLRQQSNQFNVKLNLLAEHVARAMAAGPRGGSVPMVPLIEGVARRLGTGHDDLPPDPRQIAT